MKKIAICTVAFLISLTVGIGSFALNDMDASNQWVQEARPLIKSNLHQDHHKEDKDRISHEDVRKDHKDTSDKHNEKYGRKDKKESAGHDDRMENRQNHEPAAGESPSDR